MPSVTGEGDDMFCLRCLLLPVLRGFFHRTSPLDRLTAHSDSASPSASATFRKIVSPQMTGVAPLHCGSASFHAMFCVGLHLIGRFFSALTPSPFGPRHAGQLADNAVVAVTISDKISTCLRINHSVVCRNHDSYGPSSAIAYSIGPRSTVHGPGHRSVRLPSRSASQRP